MSVRFGIDQTKLPSARFPELFEAVLNILLLFAPLWAECALNVKKTREQVMTHFSVCKVIYPFVSAKIVG
jgi:hypothetical protein